MMATVTSILFPTRSADGSRYYRCISIGRGTHFSQRYKSVDLGRHLGLDFEFIRAKMVR